MSFVQVRPRAGSGSQSLAADRTPFYGARVPDNVKLMLKAVKQLEIPVAKKIVEHVVAGLEEDGLNTKEFLSLTSEQFTEEKLRIVYSGLNTLVKLALKNATLKSEMLKEDLSQLKMSNEIITCINSVVFGKRRTKLDQMSLDQMVRFPKLTKLKWRVDVTISNSLLNRVLEPYILLEMTLSDGSVNTFEVSVSQFHELRYNVAYVLKETEDLEKRNVLKT